MVTSSYPITGDGSEAAGSFVRDLAHELARHGPCRIVAPGNQNDVENETQSLTVYRYRAPAQPLSTLKPWKLNDMFSTARVLRSGRAATMVAVAAGTTARIIALWALPCGHWARYASRRSGVPYTIWTLGSDIWTLGRVPLVRGHIRRILENAERVFADGLELSRATGKIAGRTVSFLPSTRSIDRSNASPPRDVPPYRLAFLGRWHPNKGIDLLLDVLESLNESDWAGIESFIIHGGGPLHDEVHRRTSALIDSGRPIELGGYLDKSGAEKLISQADWLIIPSRIESIPLIYSDALKLGTPMIATPVGDLEQLIHKNRTGVVSAEATASSFTAAIRNALDSSANDHLPALEEAARQFDLGRIARELAS